ncbi:hypothetical protein KIN20_022215 [Parelaphostrongylus tenuis]|uniref:Uncharacterized protein n=1 Tax=Parelaphostrongylus tenuis TaxID=148309 RepID=A0AAD5QV22_PARTN|nr:hypothetical protein KIN20_022215 [Parelaphostrongylus tenuis]
MKPTVLRTVYVPYLEIDVEQINICRDGNNVRCENVKVRLTNKLHLSPPVIPEQGSTDRCVDHFGCRM